MDLSVGCAAWMVSAVALYFEVIDAKVSVSR